VEFKNVAYVYSPSHICFFDFETMSTPREKGSVIAEQHALGYAYLIVDRQGNVVEKSSYLGVNAVNHFITSLSEAWRRIKDAAVTYPIHMTDEDQDRFQRQRQCELCFRPFDDKYPAHRHHDHSLPQNNYIGAYCSRCNLQCRDMRRYLITLAHNMSFDVSVILKEFNKPEAEVSILSKSTTQLFRVKIADLQFQDTLSVMGDSLKKLAESHVAAGYDTRYAHEMVSYLPQEVRESVCTQKQVLCYEYITNLECLKEMRLPPCEAFRDSLKQRDLSPEEYQHAQRIWEIASCRTLGDYVKLYCEIDVGLLADVYMKYRSSMQELYGLDVAHYVSLSSYAYDAFLKSTGVQLDPPYSPELYHLIKRNIRGGFVTCVRPFMRANHAGNGEAGTYVFYLDFNSLYASVMCSPLPVGDIKRLTPREMDEFLKVGIMNHATDGDTGYWLHLDTRDIAEDVARATDEFPLCLTHMNITEDVLSPHSQRLLEGEGRKLAKKNRKLVASHRGLKDHLISLDLLQLLTSLGLEIQCIHGIYSYRQSQYLKPFIERNVNQRSQETCKIKSRIFKLMSNAVYGRSMLSEVRYGLQQKYVTRKDTFLKCVASPSFKAVYPLGNQRVICMNRKKSIRIRQPNYLGFQILELAKKAMYSFWYKVIKANYGDRAKLAYEDTDSFIFSLEIHNSLNDELKHGAIANYLDTSNFPHDHPCFNGERKGQLGLLKSETGARLIKEVVILKPKMYSVLMEDDSYMTRSKGIPSCHQRVLTHQAFKDALNGDASRRVDCFNIRNVKGQICTTRVTKRTLSRFDDKRYYVEHSSLLPP